MAVVEVHIGFVASLAADYVVYSLDAASGHVVAGVEAGVARSKQYVVFVVELAGSGSVDP